MKKKSKAVLESAGWIDSHCHFDFPDFDPDRDQEWQLAQQQGICGLIIPGISRQQGQGLATLCQQRPWLYALGLHPYFLSQHQQTDLDWLDAALHHVRDSDDGLVAVGEFGLDFRKHTSDAERRAQLELFDTQLQLAKQHRLPVILHGVGAHDQIAAAIRRTDFVHGGVVHAFNGSEQQARRYLELGFKLGLGGLYLSDRALKLQRTVDALPVDSWLLETDAPDMTPRMWPQRRNSPRLIPLLAEHLAQAKGISTAELQSLQRDSLTSLLIL